MMSIIICSIILIIVGILLLKFPDAAYELTQSWKNASSTEPSNLWLISTRIGGIVCVAIGVVCLIVGIVVVDKDASHWDVTYKNPYSSEYNYWIFDKEGNLDATTYGTYSFEEKRGEVLLHTRPEDTDTSDYLEGYVMKTTDEGHLQLIPELYYFNPDLSFGAYEGELLTIEDVTMEFVSISGTLDESKRPADAKYQLIRDGEEQPVYYFFHSDGTYKSVQRLEYRVKRNNMLRIEKVNYEYSIHPFTQMLSIYMDDIELTLEKVIGHEDLYLDDLIVIEQ